MGSSTLMTSRRRRSSIEVAALDGDLQTVVDLIKSGADLNERDEGGRTPLLNAVLGGNHNICALLLREKADPELMTEDGRTALHCCAQSCSAACAQTLIEAGAKGDAVDKNGLSALDLCVRISDNTEALQKCSSKMDALPTACFRRLSTDNS